MAPQPQQLYVSGKLVEYWENPELPFRWTPADLKRYARRGQWVLLFNALALTSAPMRRE